MDMKLAPITRLVTPDLFVSLQLLSFHSLPHSFAQRSPRNSFVISRLHTLFHSTEGEGVRTHSFLGEHPRKSAATFFQLSTTYELHTLSPSSAFFVFMDLQQWQFATLFF